MFQQYSFFYTQFPGTAKTNYTSSQDEIVKLGYSRAEKCTVLNQNYYSQETCQRVKCLYVAKNKNGNDTKSVRKLFYRNGRKKNEKRISST